MPADLRKQAESPWFRSFLAFDPAPLVAKLRSTRSSSSRVRLDTQVLPHHAEKLGALANARKNAPPCNLTEVVVVPGINHLLVPAKTGEVSQTTPPPPRPDNLYARGQHGRIVEWLKAH